MKNQLKLICLWICLVVPLEGHATRFDRLIGAVAESEAAYLVKRFQVPRGSMVVGVEFYNNDLRTIFPEVLILEGPVTSISRAKLLARLTRVSSVERHRILVPFATIAVDAELDLYVAIALPPNNGVRGQGDGAGLGANTLDGPGSSYFACTKNAPLGPMDVDYGISLVFQATGKSDSETGDHLGDGVPQRTFLGRLNPSPTSGTTTITFGLERTMPVTLAIYDVAGRLVRLLLQESLPPGVHLRAWDGRNGAGQPAAAGVYMARLRAGDKVFVQKVVMASQ